MLTMRQLHISHCHNFLYDLSLTSYPLLCFVCVHRFSVKLFGGRDPICCSTLRWP